MVRRSDVWVFNIRQHHISHNFSGPDDPTVHGEADVDQPWFGKSGQAQPEMHSDDLIIIRRTSRGGDQPAGVVGLWKFSSTRPINSLDQIPWDDNIDGRYTVDRFNAASNRHIQKTGMTSRSHIDNCRVR